MIKTFCDGGINWNWYLCGDFNDDTKTVHVFYYDRWHKYEDRGSRHPKHEAGRIGLIEGEGRILIKITLDWKTEYTVTNPQQIFNYRDMTHYVSE